MEVVKLVGRLKSFRGDTRDAAFVVCIKKPPEVATVVEYLSVEMDAGPRHIVAQLPGVWDPGNRAGALLAYRYHRGQDEFLQHPNAWELKDFDPQSGRFRWSDEYCDIYEVPTRERDD